MKTSFLFATLVFVCVSASALPPSAPSPSPSPTPAAKSEEVRLIVRGVGEKGIIAERLTLQAVPGSSGSVGPGGFVRSPQTYQASGQFFVLLGYAKQGEVAEGDALTVRAYRDGVFKLTDETGAERTVPAWRVAE